MVKKFKFLNNKSTLKTDLENIFDSESEEIHSIVTYIYEFLSVTYQTEAFMVNRMYNIFSPNHTDVRFVVRNIGSCIRSSDYLPMLDFVVHFNNGHNIYKFTFKCGRDLNNIEDVDISLLGNLEEIRAFN
jgi:hypothetical protein